MDAMSLSLDEIIKKKAIGKRPTQGGPKKPGKPFDKSSGRINPGKKVVTSPKATRNNAPRGGVVSPKVRPGISKPRLVVDARMKIIQKKRAQIRDARDKLVEIARNSGDARLRLLKRKGERKLPGNGILKKGGPSSRAKPYHEDMDYEMEEVDIPRPIAPLKRTVRNEMFTVPSTMPPLPTFSRSVRNASPPYAPDDPFDCYEVHTSRPVMQKGPPLAPLPHYDDLPPRRTSSGRARSPGLPGHPLYAEDRPHLSSTMRARLERAPNPGESMGIFSKMPAEEHPSSSRSHHHHYHVPRSFPPPQ